MVKIDQDIQEKMNREAEHAAMRYIPSSVWDILTDGQKESAIRPILVAMTHVVNACSNKDTFVTHTEIPEMLEPYKS